MAGNGCGIWSAYFDSISNMVDLLMALMVSDNTMLSVVLIGCDLVSMWVTCSDSVFNCMTGGYSQQSSSA